LIAEPQRLQHTRQQAANRLTAYAVTLQHAGSLRQSAVRTMFAFLFAKKSKASLLVEMMRDAGGVREKQASTSSTEAQVRCKRSKAKSSSSCCKIGSSNTTMSVYLHGVVNVTTRQ
jgi:hypothetical protein